MTRKVTYVFVCIRSCTVNETTAASETLNRVISYQTTSRHLIETKQKNQIKKRREKQIPKPNQSHRKNTKTNQHITNDF